MKEQNIHLEKEVFDQNAMRGLRDRLPISVYVEIYQKLGLLDRALKPVSPKASLLEFGCNDGLHCLNLAKFGYRTTGFDVSSEAIRLASSQVDDPGLSSEFLVADANDLSSFGSSSFDIILMFGFLHHFYYSSGILRILKEADRIVSKNGKIFIVEPNHCYYYHFLSFTLAHFLLKIHPFNFLKQTFTLNERSLIPSRIVKMVGRNLSWNLEKMIYFDYLKEIINYQGYKGVYLFFLIKRGLDILASFLKASLKSDFFCLVFTKK
jgi:2-polyprenyl-3-methyl-5-hydroxy-6-metoxy-1,4-benzoquinol methylase